MELSEWVPQNPVEQAMADALAAGDGASFAELLMSAPLFVPDMPEPGTGAAQQVAELVPPGAAYVMAYTSVQTLAWALGDQARGYQQVDFPALRERWPDPGYQLAVNAGAPIGVFLPLRAVPELAEGKQSMVSLEVARQAMADAALAHLRAACLRGLTGEEPPDGLRDDPPGNDLETALRHALDRQDGDGFLTALLAAEVVVPASSAVAETGQIGPDFPWRVVGDEQVSAVPVFSSVAMLERTAPGERHRVGGSFLEVVVHWPDGEPALCLNPGSVTELILPGVAVRELRSAIAEFGATTPDR